MSKKELQADWLTGGLLDAEYKRYLLLAWLKTVERDFRDVKIYPGLGDLIAKHRELKTFQKEQKEWDGILRGPLKGLDFASRRLIYEHMQSHPRLQSYLDELLAFAIPEIERAMANGRHLYDIVEEHLSVEPIGIQPLYRDEGYLLVYDQDQKQVDSFRFAKSRIVLNGEPHVRMKMQPLAELKKSAFESFETMKIRIIREFPELPNPAVYLAQSSFSFPLRESLLPVARRQLMRFLAA